MTARSDRKLLMRRSVRVGRIPLQTPIVKFPADAPQHLARLRRRALTFGASFFLSVLHSLIPIKVRFLITWEAVEHEGPYVLSSSRSHLRHALKNTHIVAYTIHSTCHTSA